MGRIEKTVFISYRRTNSFMARAVYQDLTARDYDVFLDYEGINSGDFEQIILGNLRARAHFIAILTPSALERCNEPGDWFRREIEAAIDEERNIVPLFFEGFNFGTPSIAQYLTGELAKLKNYNGLDVPAHYFNEAMDRLVKRFLNVPLDAVLHPLSGDARRGADAQKAALRDTTRIAESELLAEEWFEKGNKASDLDEKIHCYNEAIRLKPDYAEAYNNRAVIRDNKGDFDGAIKDYNEAIRLKPDSAMAYTNRGHARIFKDVDAAIQDFDEAIRLQPNYAEAFLKRGLVRQWRKGDTGGAIQDYNEAIRLQPNYAYAFYYRGRARDDKGDFDGAIQDYNEAIRLKPNYAEAFYNRAIVRSEGDLDGAIEDYDEAIRLKPDIKFGMAFYYRGHARRAKGDFEGAIKDYQKYLDLGDMFHQKEVEETIKDLKTRIK